MIKTLLLLTALVTIVVTDSSGSERFVRQYGTPGSFPSSSGAQNIQVLSRGPTPQYRTPGLHRPQQDYEEPAHYEYKYDVDALEYGTKFGHQEQRQGDMVRGTYYVLLADGRTQVVEYFADQTGFHPMISYQGGGAGGHSGLRGYA